MIKLNLKYSKFKILEEDKKQGLVALQKLMELKEMTGWIDKPISSSEVRSIKLLAREVRRDCDVFIVCGIGGSFMGAKAVIDSLKPYFGKDDDPEIIFVGKDLSGEYLKEVLNYIKHKRVYINVISKSGGTLETKLAFNILKDYMKKTFKDWQKRIIVTTGEGELKNFAIKNDLTIFNVPENIGGRYSVLSVVGLLPIAIMGLNIDELLIGANLNKNEILSAIDYAIIRNTLYKNGYKVEALTVYEKKYINLLNWTQQLFGESQGKNKMGILPFANIHTTNLHSIGQFFQEGSNIVFLSVIKENGRNIFIKELDVINKNAVDCVAEAFIKGDTPSIIIEIDKMCEKTLGKLLKFLMYTSAIGGIIMSVNPFNQEGVEEYKKLINATIK